jgi:hypothetical protein
MPIKYLSIQDAASISKKSIQTIRRAIKAKKLKVRRQSTPQGFNYLVEEESFFEFYSIKPAQSKKQVKDDVIEVKKETENLMISKEDFRAFTKTLESLVNQHSEERQNFLRLVNTLQEKIFVLENQLNLLKAPGRKWFQFWK